MEKKTVFFFFWEKVEGFEVVHFRTYLKKKLALEYLTEVRVKNECHFGLASAESFC